MLQISTSKQSITEKPKLDGVLERLMMFNDEQKRYFFEMNLQFCTTGKFGEKNQKAAKNRWAGKSGKSKSFITERVFNGRH